MTTIQEQIRQQKQQKSENIKDLFYVDDCYHCKDNEIRTKENVTCNHNWYCHHDNGQVQELESKIGKIQHDTWMRGYMCSYEYKNLQELKNLKFELIKECRRNMPKIKHPRR
jgi:hypothetical protein